MQPLVQMHPTVQHPSPGFDVSPTNDGRHDKHFDPNIRHAEIMKQTERLPTGAQSQWALPIRTSHTSYPNYRPQSGTSIPSPAFNTTEHHLRRKTPAGTIEAGYDGSSVQFASRPPALKHMILSSSLNATVPRGPSPNGRAVHLTPGSRDNMDAALIHDTYGTSNHMAPWNTAFRVGAVGDFSTPADLQSPPLSRLSSSGPGGLHQQQIYPYVGVHPGLQGGGYAMPEAPVALGPRGQNCSQSFLSGPGFFPQHQAPVFAPCFPQSYTPTIPMHVGMPNSISQFSPPPLTFGQHHFQTPPHYGAPPNLTPFPSLDVMSLDSAGLPRDSHGSLAFRERAMSQAHRAYLDLLAHLHHTRRFQNAASGSGPKLLVFPKPLQQVSRILGSQGDGNPQASQNSAVALSFQSGTGHNISNIRHSFQMPPFDSPESWSHRGSQMFGPMVAANSALSPLAQAKVSLDMLTQMCEQTDWQWADGIMLGGCLQFGLDRFESALEWFTRVTVLDPRNAEAFCNTAATLYCLHRQDEAEKAWLQAIHIRPGSLEAVEHLVGLLYKKRSYEAIGVIEFVQKSLRMFHLRGATGNSTVPPLDAVHTLGDTRALGFGSSGYAVPGSDNGRILALVHAKGTMLYSLKDIEGASRSFEEAVLISAGRAVEGVEELIGRIQTVLSNSECARTDSGIRPLLLPPEQARLTAKLVFAGNGELSGLRFMPDGGAKRAAVQTTSNSLLSLAKILQDAMSSGSSGPSLLRRPSGIADILSLYYLSLSLQESPSTANNVGILLASVQQSVSTSTEASPKVSQQPTIPGVPPGSGLSLALAYYNYGLALDPKHVHLHTNLGSLLKDIGQLDLAIQMYEKAVACDGTFDIALTNLANAVKDRGRVSDAIAYYKRAVKSNPDFAEAVCGLSTALNSVCDWRGRGGVVLHSGKYDRWHVDAQGMLIDSRVQGVGVGLTKRVVDIVRKQLGDAQTWGIGVLQKDVIATLATAMRHSAAESMSCEQDWLTRLETWSKCRWEGSRVLRLIERLARASMRQWYRDKYVLGLDTSITKYKRVSLPASLTIPSAPTVLPFHTFTCPLTAEDIRVISQRNALRISCSTLKSPWLPDTVFPPPSPPSPQLKVGYVSSDFNNHPLAHLMQSVFGFHDIARVHAFCYATTANDGSAHRLQIEREAPTFRDVSSWSSDRLVKQIVEDGIHILVNLNGYTRGARNDIFAARPAPIQMSFMGFAGTLGAEWCDYILADAIAIPQETLRPCRRNVDVQSLFDDGMHDAGGDWVYSENVIFSKGTFFCCDHAQSSDPEEHRVSWEDEQRRRWAMRKELFPTIPDDTVIMGNFNQLYKIDPSTFRTWLRILSHIPNAVLWLLRFPELGEANLRRTARSWAGTEVASRLVFTDVAPKNQHISRARVCDLFLDTPECNAHTTAADVLWSSTPLLTLPRYPFKMCSRMAASILRGALPRNCEGDQAAEELTVVDEEDYENTAIRLARNLTYRVDKGYGEGVGRLAELRKLLWESKWTCPLFDTRRWVADLESAYDEAWRKWVAAEEGDIYL